MRPGGFISKLFIEAIVSKKLFNVNSFAMETVSEKAIMEISENKNYDMVEDVFYRWKINGP